MSDYVIETDGLTRYFGNKAAVKQLDLKIPRGGVFALLGRNGSGKTTTIRMLLGLLSPTRGTAKILGQDSSLLDHELRARVGYLSEGHFVYGWMRVGQCATFQQQCFPNWNQKIFDAVVDHFQLDRDTKAKNLSRGERAGLCLALTLAPEPELLILDDPALGLDPVARRSLVEAMLAVTRGKNRTIFFCSHLLDDVERVADRIAIIDRGVLRVSASVDEFCRRMGRWVLRFEKRPPDVPPITGLVHTRVHENELHLTIANGNEETEKILAKLGATNVEKVPLSMENAVIDFLGERGRSGSLLQAVGGDL